MASITYGHGFLDDGGSTTNWSETESGITGTLSVNNGDVLEIKCEDIDSANDEFVYYEKDITDISSSIYKKILIRYKTSESGNGCGARVSLRFDDATNQFVLGETEPEFSTTWKTVSVDITSGKTIDKIRLWADDYPDSINSGTYYVYYDFVLIHRDIVTFPTNLPENIKLEIPTNDVEIPIPGRVGGVTQRLGSPLATVRISGNMEHKDKSTWGLNVDGVETDVYGRLFYDIVHECHAEPWQWLDIPDFCSMKVTMQMPNISMEADSKVQRKYELIFKEYRLSDAANETYSERFGL